MDRRTKIIAICMIVLTVSSIVSLVARFIAGDFAGFVAIANTVLCILMVIVGIMGLSAIYFKKKKQEQN